MSAGGDAWVVLIVRRTRAGSIDSWTGTVETTV